MKVCTAPRQEHNSSCFTTPEKPYSSMIFITFSDLVFCIGFYQVRASKIVPFWEALGTNFGFFAGSFSISFFEGDFRVNGGPVVR